MKKFLAATLLGWCRGTTTTTTSEDMCLAVQVGPSTVALCEPDHHGSGVSWQSLLNFMGLALMLGLVLGMFCGWKLHKWCLEDEKDVAEQAAAKEAAEAAGEATPTAAEEAAEAAGEAAPTAPTATGEANRKKDQRVQGPVTYRRDLAQPRYQPLAGWQWGATEEFSGLF
jgi:hypothetical protein